MAWGVDNASQLFIFNQDLSKEELVELKVRNPVAPILNYANFVIVAGAGDLYRNISDYAGLEILERSAGGTHTHRTLLLQNKKIIDLAIAGNILVALEYLDYGKSRLHLVDLDTLELVPNISNLLEWSNQLSYPTHISAITTDGAGHLWMAVFGASSKRGLWKYSIQSDTIETHISTALNPTALTYCSE
jgi:hypothetical protein